MIYKYKQKMKSQYLRSGTEESAFRVQREVWAEHGWARGHLLTCEHAWTARAARSGEPGAETTVHGALIFGRTEVMIMVKTISIKAMKLQKKAMRQKRDLTIDWKGPPYPCPPQCNGYLV